MPYYMTARPQTLQLALGNAKHLAKRHKDMADFYVSRGIPRSILRDAKQQDYWEGQVRLIEAVARKRGITLAP